MWFQTTRRLYIREHDAPPSFAYGNEWDVLFGAHFGLRQPHSSGDETYRIITSVGNVGGFLSHQAREALPFPMDAFTGIAVVVVH